MSIHRKWKLFNLFIALLFCGILTVVSSSLSIRFQDVSLDYAKVNIAVIISQIIVYGIPILIYYSINDYLDKKYLNQDTSLKNENQDIANPINLYSLNGLRNILITLMVSIATVLIMYIFKNFILNFLYAFFDMIPSNFLEPHDHIEATTMTIQQLIISIISIVFVSSVLEEIFFRGIVVKSYNYLPAWLTIFFSTICFTLAHHSLIQMALILPLGFVSALILLKTNNIIYSILIHASANIFAIINFPIDEMLFSAKYAIKYSESKVALSNSFFCFAFLVVITILIVFLINLINDSGKFKEGKEEEHFEIMKIQKKSNKGEWIYYGAICTGFCLYILYKLVTLH